MSLPQPRNVLSFEGQIDLNVSAKVTEKINQLIKEKPARLVVDLSGVTYIDSSGLAVLINATRDMEDYGGIFLLGRGPGGGLPLFATARLGKFFLLYSKTGEGLAAAFRKETNADRNFSRS